MKNIVIFSLPYLLSYFLQTLYGLADLYFIGQYNPPATTTAVSAGSQVMHMLTVITIGLAVGMTVMISQGVGARNRDTIRKAIGNGMVLFTLVAIVLTIILSFTIGPIVKVMKTPTEAEAEMAQYLRICFLGVPFIIAYNVISSIFRGMGDSKSPLLFIAIACAANIVLDYLFIGVLGLGARGAALGTVLAQTISVIISLIFVIRRKLITITKKDLVPEAKCMGRLLGVGAPVAVQDGLIQISFLVITAVANKRGVEIAAAVGIVEKIIGIVFLVPSTMSSTVSAVCAQNNGAGEHIRAKKTMWYAIYICIGFGLICSVVCQFIAKPLVGLFTTEEVVAVYGAQYLRTYVVDCIFAGMHFCFSGFFAAYNMSILSFGHNLASILICRIPGALIASAYWPDNLTPMGMAAPAGSILSLVICIVAYTILCKVSIQPKIDRRVEFN